MYISVCIGSKFESIYAAQVHSQCVESKRDPVNLYVSLVVQIRLFYCTGYFCMNTYISWATQEKEFCFIDQSFVYLQSVMVILSGCGIE